MTEMKFICSNCALPLSVEETADSTVVLCPRCFFETTVPPSHIFPGLVFLSYCLKMPLKSGETGDLWLALDISSGHHVMLRLLSEKVYEDINVRQRFWRETKNISRFNHPHIIKYLGGGKELGINYIITSCIEGGTTLDRHLAENRGRVPEGHALGIIRKMAEAFDYLWTEHHLLHLNIKPSSVFVSRDLSELLLMNFGLSEVIYENPHTAGKGLLLGTPKFMAPELLDETKIPDCRADIYSAGIMFYRLLAGQCPDSEKLSGAIQKKNKSFITQSLKNAVPGLSETVVTIIAKMTACDRDERFMNWKEVLENVRAISSPDTETIPAIKLPPKKKREEEQDSEHYPKKKWKTFKPSHEKQGAVEAKYATGINLSPLNKTGIYNAKNTDAGKVWPFFRKSTIAILIILLSILGFGSYLLIKASEYKKLKKIEAQRRIEQEQKQAQTKLAAAQAQKTREREDKVKRSLRDALVKARYVIKKAQDRPEIMDVYIDKLKDSLVGTGCEKEFNDEVEKMKLSIRKDTERDFAEDAPEAKVDKFTKVMRETAEYLLEGNTSAAAEGLILAKNKEELKSQRKLIENIISIVLKLKDADGMIAASFENQKGNTITIKTSLGKAEIKGKLVEVNLNGIIIQDVEGEQTIVRNNDLSMSEKLNRLEAEGTEFGKFYAVVTLLRTGKVLEANESYIQNASNPLFEAMLLKSQRKE